MGGGVIERNFAYITIMSSLPSGQQCSQDSQQANFVDHWEKILVALMKKS